MFWDTSGLDNPTASGTGEDHHCLTYCMVIDHFDRQYRTDNPFIHRGHEL